MDSSFDRAWEIVKGFEGGYTKDPNDPGGETKYGISKRAYPDEDIVGLTEKRARQIFRRDYWDRVGCGDLPVPLDIIVADTAFNCGIGKALAFAATAGGDWRACLLERIKHYVLLAERRPSMRAFLRGWLNRVVSLYDRANQGGETG
jgi:lysozyme family protein